MKEFTRSNLQLDGVEEGELIRLRRYRERDNLIGPVAYNLEGRYTLFNYIGGPGWESTWGSDQRDDDYERLL